MEIDVLTLFPRIFAGPLEESILKRAQQKGLVGIRVHNLRDFTHDKHRVVDDKPYGGGPGMLMKPEPIFEAVEKFRRTESRVVLMTPQGSPLTQGRAQEFSRRNISTASKIGSGFINMPGPPPYGLSSTTWCLSCVNFRKL